MAEEDKESKSDAAKTNPKGSARKWIIIGVVVLFLGGGGYAAWDFLLAERLLGKSDPQVAETEHRVAEARERERPIFYQMESYIVNLLGKEGKRYLKATIELEVEANDIKEELTRRAPQLRDGVLLLLSSKSFEDISSPEGKIHLRNELIARINQFLPGGGIRMLYFTEFVVQ